MRSGRATSHILRSAAFATASAWSISGSAAPVFNIKILALDVTQGQSSYSATVAGVSVGDVINYQIVGNMSPAGTIYNGPPGFTITSLSAGLDGGNALRFDLFQTTDQAIQTNFIGAGTLINGWNASADNSTGQLVSRGNGYNDITGVRPGRATNTYSALTPEILYTGSFTVASTGSGSSSLLKLRWGSGSGAIHVNGSGLSRFPGTVTEIGANPMIDFALLTLATSAGPSVNTSWNSDASGTWSGGPWSNGAPAASAASPYNATLGSAINSPRSIAMTSPGSVSTLSFNSTVAYSIDGPNSLTIAQTNNGPTPVAMPSISVASGNHTISAPMAFSSALASVSINVNAGASLTCSAVFGSNSFNKSGPGRLTVGSLRTGAATVSAGAIQISPSLGNSSTCVLPSLPAVSTGALFDLADARLIVQFGSNSSPLTSTRASIVAGRNGTDFAAGDWQGTGGISSSAAAPGGIGDGTNGGDGVSFAIGYVENSFLPQLGLPSYTAFGGQTVDGGSMLIRFTKGADANLDGRVNSDDVTIVGALFNSAGTGEWFLGDFDYDGICESDDVTVLGALYDPTAPALGAAQLEAQYGNEFAAAFARGQSLKSSVPEPGTGALIAFSATVLLARRRRVMPPGNSRGREPADPATIFSHSRST